MSSKTEYIPLGFDTIDASPGQLFTEDMAVYTTWRGVTRVRKNKRTDELVMETAKITNAPYMVGRSLIKGDSRVPAEPDPAAGIPQPADEHFVKLFDPQKFVEQYHIIFNQPKVPIKRMGEVFIQAWENNRIVSPNPYDIYKLILDQATQYVDFGDEDRAIQGQVLTLWIMATYVYKLFPAFPYIYLTGSLESGKTKIMRFIEMIGFNAKNTVDITGPSLFRTVEDLGATILVDESEYLKNPEKRADIRALLLSGYQEGGEVLRTEGDIDKVQRYFKVYSPKIMANITGIEDVLESRCISFLMMKTMNTEIANRKIPEKVPIWQRIRSDLYAMGLYGFQEIKAIYKTIDSIKDGEKEITARDFDLWSPLIAMAKYIFKGTPDEGNALINRLIDFASMLGAEKRGQALDMNNDFIIAIHLRNTVRIAKWVPVKDIAQLLKPEFPWLKSSRYVWRSLKRIGFKRREMSHGSEYFIDPEKLRLYCSRYDIVVQEAPAKEKEPEAGTLDAAFTEMNNCSQKVTEADKELAQRVTGTKSFREVAEGTQSEE